MERTILDCSLFYSKGSCTDIDFLGNTIRSVLPANERRDAVRTLARVFRLLPPLLRLFPPELSQVNGVRE